jgi:hypothetical protein
MFLDDIEAYFSLDFALTLFVPNLKFDDWSLCETRFVAEMG